MRAVSRITLSLLAFATPLASASDRLDDIDALSLMQLRAEKRPKSSETQGESKAAANAQMHEAPVVQKGPRGSCVFTSPVRGRSPGKALERREDVATLEDCQQLCEVSQQCRAVEFASGDGTCTTLARMFDGNLEPAPEGSSVVVANKMVCGASALALSSSEGSGNAGESVAFSDTGGGSVQPRGRRSQEFHARGDGQVATFSGAENSFIELKDLPDTFGGPSGFSIAFTSTWAALGHDTHLVDFGSERGKNSIVVGNIRDTSGLTFFVDQSGAKLAVDVKHAIDVNKTSRYLCTVDGQGHMRVFRDGKLIGENKKGQAPVEVARDFLFIGKPQGKGSMFKGQLSDLCIWNENVDWEESESCISNGSSSLLYAAHILPTTWSHNPALGN